MKNLKDLESQFNFENVSFESDNAGLIYVLVKNNFAEAKIALQGAHVISFKKHNEADILWMSEHSYVEANRPFRGGIPICWPWFGANAKDNTLPAHGFARISNWELFNVRNMRNGATQLTFLLTNNSVAPEFNTQEFELYYQVTIGSSLECVLTMKNLSNRDFELAAALHTYFNINSIENVVIRGLEGLEFLNTIIGERSSSPEPITFDSETDRVYFDDNQTTTIEDKILNRKIVVEKFNSYSTVVWNPWIDKAKRMPDFGDNEYHTMVCVESCNCKDDSRTIAPNETYSYGCKISSVNYL